MTTNPPARTGARERVKGLFARHRRWSVGAIVATVALAAVAVGAVGWVQLSPQGRMHSVEDVPQAPVALVLGAGLRPDGTPSLFLARRLDVARALFDQGKVRAILVSGDNSRADYDEPSAMRAWLVAHGVRD